MRTRRVERLGLALLLVIGCIVFGRSLIEDAQAQQQSAPPPPPTPPTQSSAVNPSNPSTAPQQSYTPLKPSTQSTTPSTSTTSSSELTPGHQAIPNTTTRSERTSVAKTRSVHHYRYRGRPTLVIYPHLRGRFRVNLTRGLQLDKSPRPDMGKTWGRTAVFVIAGIAGTDCSLIEIIC